jgi:hypothetical protein
MAAEPDVGLAFSRSYAPDAEYGESKNVFRSGASAVRHLDDGMLAGVAIALMDAVRYVNGTVGIDVADVLKTATADAGAAAAPRPPIGSRHRLTGPYSYDRQ